MRASLRVVQCEQVGVAYLPGIFDVQLDRGDRRAFASSAIFAWRLYDGDLRHWTYGATNGAITTFVIVAGVVGADLPTMLAPVLGLANLFAIGFATGARRYINTKLARDGYDLALAKQVRPEDVSEKDNDLSLHMRSSARAALNTFAAFILCGLVPLIAHLLAPTNFIVCIAATACALFVIGAGKSLYSLTAWWRSGLDAVFLGMCAGTLAFAAGHTLHLLIHIPRP